MSRLLVLQSKRLMLDSVHRLLRESRERERQIERLEGLRLETHRAQEAYQEAMLRLGSPATGDYWVVAYSRLISSGSSLVTKMRATAADLPPLERGQAGDEVRELEKLIERWTESMQKSMSEAVA